MIFLHGNSHRFSESVHRTDTTTVQVNRPPIDDKTMLHRTQNLQQGSLALSNLNTPPPNSNMCSLNDVDTGNYILYKFISSFFYCRNVLLCSKLQHILSKNFIATQSVLPSDISISFFSTLQLLILCTCQYFARPGGRRAYTGL